jgi:diguanylate cyclase (GGDEF)-like protein
MNQPAPLRAPEIHSSLQEDVEVARAESSIESGVQSARPKLITGVAIEDYDDLLGAVTERLRQTVSEGPAAAKPLQAGAVSDNVKSSMLECVEALDQLHMTLKDDLERRRLLELEVASAKIALERTRAELIDTEAEARRANHLALHDSLTALPNRGFFRERLEYALKLMTLQNRPFAVLYLYLDGFKPVNDTHGHNAGDELLKIVAARLTRAVRAEDMVSRLGGDEFACLLADLPCREQLGQLAQKLYESVSAPVKIGHLRIQISPSIGIAMCPVDGTNADSLINNADTAMYHAKQLQSGHLFFDQCDTANLPDSVNLP